MKRALTATLAMCRFYSHFMDVMGDDQEDGQVTNVAPNVRFAGRPGTPASRRPSLRAVCASLAVWLTRRARNRAADPAWGAAYPLITDWLWKYHGDEQALAANYGGVKAWVQYLASRASQRYARHSICKV